MKRDAIIATLLLMDHGRPKAKKGLIFLKSKMLKQLRKKYLY